MRPEPVTLDAAVRGQPVRAAEADGMNAAFDGFVGLRLHRPTRLDDETGLMVVLHGWGGTYTQYDVACSAWAERFNVVTLQVNYRNSGSGAPIYDFGKYQAVDVLRAMDHVLQTLPVNPRRIIGWGGSGGGDVILQAAKMAPHTFAGIVAVAGITKPTDAADRVAGYATDPEGGWQAKALGAGSAYTVAEYQVRNPQHDASLYRAPIVILHGDADQVVSVQHARQLRRVLEAAGKAVRLHEIAWADHGFGSATDADENDRFKATNRYAADLILKARTDGPTDFRRGGVVRLATDGGDYLVDYGGAEGVRLTCPRG